MAIARNSVTHLAPNGPGRYLLDPIFGEHVGDRFGAGGMQSTATFYQAAGKGSKNFKLPFGGRH
jgi:hypothetical protein